MKRLTISKYYKLLIMFILGMCIDNAVVHAVKLGDWMSGISGTLIVFTILVVSMLEWHFIERPLRKQKSLTH